MHQGVGHSGSHSRMTDKYLVETPDVQRYKGFLKLEAPKVTADDGEILGTDDPETSLQKLYQNDEEAMA